MRLIFPARAGNDQTILPRGRSIKIQLNDGKPVSRHAFDGLQYITHANRFFGYDGARAKDARREIGGYSEMSEMSKMRYSIVDSLKCVLRLLLFAAMGVGAAITPALAARSTIDSITVQWREAVLPESAPALTDAARAALSAALGMPFIEVGRARDGAFRLNLPRPLPVDEARAAVNRVRMLPQVPTRISTNPNREPRRLLWCRRRRREDRRFGA